MTVTIRDSRIEDAKFVSHVNIRAWKESYSLFMDAKDINSLDIDKMTMRRQKVYAEKNKYNLHLVVEEEGKIIGFCEGGVNRGHIPYGKGEIYTFYILQSHQNKGIGKKLLLYALKKLKKIQLSPIVVAVLKDNTQARAFYEHMGGKLVGKTTFNSLSRPYPELIYLFD